MGLVFEDIGHLFLFRFGLRLPFTLIVWPYGYVTLFTASSISAPMPLGRDLSHRDWAL